MTILDCFRFDQQMVVGTGGAIVIDSRGRTDQ